MLPAVLLCALAAAAAAPAAPVAYDQRQDGDFNVRADVKNVLLLVALPKVGQLMTPSLLDFVLSKGAGARGPGPQERADVQLMEAFVEPSTPYRVEIGGERAGGDGRAADVVIAGRRRAPEPQPDADDIKLLGALEQCGPDRERDPVTLSCRARAAPRDPAPRDPAHRDPAPLADRQQHAAPVEHDPVPASA